MYSYRDNTENIKESGAIRRSMGDVNPNYQPNRNYNKKTNKTNSHQLEISEKSSELSHSNNNINYYWIPNLILACLEGIIILALALLFEREFELNENDKDHSNCTLYENGINLHNNYKDEINFNYGKLRDLNIMAFVGYGLLHSILQQNSWTSFSMNILILALSVQIAMFFNFVWRMAFREEWEEEKMDFYFINKAIFISCVVSVTYGSVLGRLSIIQHFIMAIFEIVLATMNFQLCEEKLETVDTGGALYVHLFGALFALSISVVLFCSSKEKNKIQRFEHLSRSSYFSNITSFLGLLILFVFFPSFNSVLIWRKQAIVNRGRINTYLSLFGSVIGSLVTSGIINGGKVVLEQILYGTLSGGIIISGCCSVCFDHWAALILGTLSAPICVVLLAKVKPFFIGWGLRDTCNVLITHGIFGLLGGFITPMFISGLKDDNIRDYKLFYDTGRSKERQAGIQVGGLFITLGISFVGGIATGFLMKVSTCYGLNWIFTDAELFRDFREEDFNNRFQIDDDDKGSQPSYY